MLADRYYLRSETGIFRPSATNIILVINVIVFLVLAILDNFAGFNSLKWFSLNPRDIARGFIWELFTFQFLHSGLIHLLLNSLAIYIFGKPIESQLGAFSFLKLYFGSGCLGGIFHTLLAWLFPTQYYGYVVGASAGAFGLVAAYGALYPEQPLTMLVAFIFPISMRAKFLLLISAIIAFLGLVSARDGIAHAAHLGGMAFGLFYVVFIVRPWNGLIRWHPPTLSEIKEKFIFGKRAHEEEINYDIDENSENYITDVIDPILDKIARKGIHSLTARERRILEKAREKLANQNK